MTTASKRLRSSSDVAASQDQREAKRQTSIHDNIARDRSNQWNGNDFLGNTVNITNNHHSVAPAESSVPKIDIKPRVHPPRRPNSSFIGQEDVLKHMRESLLPASRSVPAPSPFVLQGIGGVGKSEIVLQFVERHKSSYWGLFWVDFGSEDKARAAYTLIAKRCGWSVFEDEDPVGKVVNRLGEIDEHWLLILDNCDKPDIDYSTWLPGGCKGSIIITTRLPEVAKVYGESNGLEISGLGEDSTVALLLKGAEIPMPVPAQSYYAAVKIARQLDCHALAATVAASMLRKGRYGLEEYSRVLSQTRTQVELFQTKLKQEVPRYGTAFATFEVSAEELRNVDPESGKHALDLLSTLGFLDRTSVSEELFTRAWTWGYRNRNNADEVNLEPSGHALHRITGKSPTMHQDSSEVEGVIESTKVLPSGHDGLIAKLWPSHFDAALDFAWATTDMLSFRKARERLSELSLIGVDRESQVITMHPLLHSWSRHRLLQGKALSAWISTAATLCLSSEKRHGWQDFTPHLRPHFESCFDLWPNKDTNTVPTLEVCSLLMQSWWQLYWAESKYCIDIVTKLESRFPTKQTPAIEQVDRNRLETLRIKEYTLQDLRDYSASLEITEQMVAAYKASCSEDDVDLLRAQHSMAISLSQLDRTRDALEIMHEVVRIGEGSLPSDDTNLLAYKHDLGKFLIANDQSEEAVAVLGRLVQIRRQKLSCTDPASRNSQHELGRAYLGIGDSEKAIEILEDVVHFKSDLLLRTDQSKATLQRELERQNLNHGAPQNAHELVKEDVGILRAAFPHTHGSLLASQHVLGKAYLQNGQPHDAVRILESVVLARSSLPTLDHGRLISQHELIRALSITGRVDQASDLEKQIDYEKNKCQPNKVCAADIKLLEYCLQNKQPRDAMKLFESLQSRADVHLNDDQRKKLTSSKDRLMALDMGSGSVE